MVESDVPTVTLCLLDSSQVGRGHGQAACAAARSVGLRLVVTVHRS